MLRLTARSRTAVRGSPGFERASTTTKSAATNNVGRKGGFQDAVRITHEPSLDRERLSISEMNNPDRLPAKTRLARF
jgi:hypothetical protein